MTSAKQKRHHWWPMLQSMHWRNDQGCVNCFDLVENKSFSTQPQNIGVEGQLYSKKTHHGWSTEIESWFSEEVDGPFSSRFETIFDFVKVQKQLFTPDPTKLLLNKKLGFEIDQTFRHLLPISVEDKTVIANYIAGLVIRSPTYINRLVDFHKTENANLGNARNLALDNMQWLHGIYVEKILTADLMVMRSVGQHEFLYGDNAVYVEEPWRLGPLPFDIYAPITPEFSINVLPVAGANFPNHMIVSRGKNRLVARYNRKVVSYSSRFIFSRSMVPIDFINRYKNKQVPSPFGIRKVRGEVQVTYDEKRDR